jgi:hypothetical protein
MYSKHFTACSQHDGYMRIHKCDETVKHDILKPTIWNESLHEIRNDN